MKPKGSSRISYTARFKLTVVTYALEKGNREAARQFQVDEKNVRRWCSQQEKLKGLCRNQRAAWYCPAKFPELEKELKEWIDEKRKAGIGIFTTVIRLKAKSMAKARNIAESEFRASVHWCHRFMDRHDLSIRRRTTISGQNLRNFRLSSLLNEKSTNMSSRWLETQTKPRLLLTCLQILRWTQKEQNQCRSWQLVTRKIVSQWC